MNNRISSIICLWSRAESLNHKTGGRDQIRFRMLIGVSEVEHKVKNRRINGDLS